MIRMKKKSSISFAVRRVEFTTDHPRERSLLKLLFMAQSQQKVVPI